MTRGLIRQRETPKERSDCLNLLIWCSVIADSWLKVMRELFTIAPALAQAWHSSLTSPRKFVQLSSKGEGSSKTHWVGWVHQVNHNLRVCQRETLKQRFREVTDLTNFSTIVAAAEFILFKKIRQLTASFPRAFIKRWGLGEPPRWQLPLWDQAQLLLNLSYCL